MSSTADEIREQLRDNAASRAAVEEDRRTNAAGLRELVVRAKAENWSITAIAEAAGVSRQTVHEILKENTG